MQGQQQVVALNNLHQRRGTQTGGDSHRRRPPHRKSARCHGCGWRRLSVAVGLGRSLAWSVMLRCKGVKGDVHGQ